MSGKMQDGMNISFNKSLVTNELPSGDALKVRLGNWLLDNPVIPASGTFGYGYEFAELYDINCLGTFSFKGTTLEPRFGNPTPRIAECPAGIINSIGLQNPGVDAVINNELPRLIERSNENTIKVWITLGDLKKREVNILDLMNDKNKVENFFYSILEEVDDNHDFQNNDLVSFQILPESDGFQMIKIGRASCRERV